MSSEYQKAYYAANRERIDARNKKNREKNLAKYKAYSKAYAKEYCVANKEQLRAYNEYYHAKNQEDILRRKKDYYIKNKESLSAKQKKYYEINKKRINAKGAVKRLEAYHTDPNVKLATCLRTRLHTALKGNQKAAATLSLLGCSLGDFKEYLSKKFTTGMSWDNYGEWHIDHIRPICSFNLVLPEEQTKCFHYTNLQPLWATDNLKKGGRYGI